MIAALSDPVRYVETSVVAGFRMILLRNAAWLIYRWKFEKKPERANT